MPMADQNQFTKVISASTPLSMTVIVTVSEVEPRKEIMKYKVDFVGNKREITALLKDEHKKLIESFKDPVFIIPLVIIGSNLKDKTMQWHYAIEGDKCVVKFSVHKFVDKFISVEGIAAAAEEYLTNLSRGMK